MIYLDKSLKQQELGPPGRGRLGAFGPTQNLMRESHTMQKHLAAILMAFIASSALAVGDREPPTSWQTELSVRSFEVPAETFPAIDPEQLRQRDADPSKMGEPLQFAETFASRSNTVDNGRWDTLADGDRIWRFRVKIPGATDINIGFSHFELPPGARLHIYDTKQTFFQGGWDDADASEGQFWTPVIPGPSAMIELYVPAGAGEPRLQLEQVAGGYRDFFGHNGGPFMTRQGACNNDVICPEGDPWRDEIRSVAVYQRSGQWACTGSLVNDVPNSLTPYFLTANHCGLSTSNDETMVVYWNFESPNCGDLSGGSLDQNQTGATIRSSREDVDMALVELNQEPPEAFGVHYAGWDRTNTQPGGTVAIHHPSTDEKAISFAESDLATTASCIGGPGTPDTHWEVPFWDDGTTEPGSSGSGIWNPQNKRLIGFLSGGLAACGNQEFDCYGKFAVAWDGSSAGERLRDWLDPAGTNPDGIDGTDPDSYNLVPDSTSISQCSFDDIDISIAVTQSGSFADPVTLTATGLPAGVADSLSVNPVTPPDSTVLTLGSLDQAGTGSFQFDIEGSGGGLDRTASIDIILSDASPADTAVTAPSNGALGVVASPTITWNASAQAAEYELEIATDAAFTNVVYSATEAGTSHEVGTPLDTSTEYHVRVRAANDCGLGNWSQANAFTTEALPGDCPVGTQSASLMTEDFDSDSLPEGWSTAGSSGAVTWVPSSIQAESGTHSVFAENIDSVSDQRLTSASVTLPDDAVSLFLTFQNWQAIEDSTDGCFDGGLLEISTDDGASWSQVGSDAIQVRDYDGLIDNAFGNPLADNDGWCGDPRDFWERYSVDLGAWAGQDVRFRFRFGTDESISRTGWHVDSVEVKACESSEPIIFEDRFEDAASR